MKQMITSPHTYPELCPVRYKFHDRKSSQNNKVAQYVYCKFFGHPSQPEHTHIEVYLTYQFRKQKLPRLKTSRQQQTSDLRLPVNGLSPHTSAPPGSEVEPHQVDQVCECRSLVHQKVVVLVGGEEQLHVHVRRGDEEQVQDGEPEVVLRDRLRRPRIGAELLRRYLASLVEAVEDALLLLEAPVEPLRHGVGVLRHLVAAVQPVEHHRFARLPVPEDYRGEVERTPVGVGDGYV